MEAGAGRSRLLSPGVSRIRRNLVRGVTEVLSLVLRR